MYIEPVSSLHINACPLCKSKPRAIRSSWYLFGTVWKIRCTNKKCGLTYGGYGVDNCEYLQQMIEQWNRLVAVNDKATTDCDTRYYNPVSLSDCVKCFDTPCVCGYHYRKMDKSLRIERAATILGIDKNKLIKLVNKITPEKHPMFDEKDI